MVDTDRNPILDIVKLVDVRRLSELLGISQRQCWRLSGMAEAGLDKLCNGFPRPLRLATKTIRWRLRDIDAYLARLAGEEGR